ncbi:AAA family ATPase [Sphingomonas brevis]|uniref:AAA family ATPase n=1 Tax=Sphingomonas brevis TaxID=2908206 RepID=UPI003D69D39F
MWENCLGQIFAGGFARQCATYCLDRRGRTSVAPLSGEIATIDDYIRAATRLRRAIGPHLEKLLRTGLNVVLDFQANTPTARAWIKTVVESAGADHQLHYLDVSDEVCKSRLAERNASGTHEYQVSEADFELFNSYVVPPASAEGFNVVIHPMS